MAEYVVLFAMMCATRTTFTAAANSGAAMSREAHDAAEGRVPHVRTPERLEPGAMTKVVHTGP